MRRRESLAAISMIAMLAAAARAAGPVELPGKVDAVTVYRGQALVTRVIDLPAPAGLREIVVTNLPERVVPGSLFAEADPTVEVRGVRFRTRPVSQDVREDVRKLDTQIRDLQDAQAANTRAQQLSAEHKNYLDKLEQFTAPTATAELTKGVLNAETLKTLTLFTFDQRESLATNDLKLAKTARDLADQLSFLQRQYQDLTAGASKIVREAVVFANLKNAGGQLRLKYLVDSAGWSPSYVARAADGKAGATRPVGVQYNASIQQTSGEDWSDVVMTLSTATPSMVAAAPELDPLQITLAAAEANRAGDVLSYQSQKTVFTEQRKQLEFQRNSSVHDTAANAPAGQANAGPGGFGGGGFGGDSFRVDADLNAISGKLQVLELVTKDASRDNRNSSVTDQEGVSVVYQLPARTSLPSRADQQSIQIATLEMSGDFYKLAMPVLTSYVYDQATVANQSKIVLLAGPVASYFNDQYVGTGAVPTVAIGERFTVGFGIDSSLRATRELIDKTETTQGGNRVMNFSYRLAVENFGATPATVRVVDRLPTSKNQDVKVTVLSNSKEPTTQPVGPSVAGTKSHHAGILNWSLDVPAQSLGEHATAIDYQYKLEFDKQLSIAGITGDR